MIKTLLFTSLLIGGVAQATEIKPLLTCWGDDGENNYTVTLRTNVDGTYVATVSESSGGGEDLDEDTITLKARPSKLSMIFWQNGKSSDKMVEGFRLQVADNKARLSMATTPSGNTNIKAILDCEGAP